MSRLASRNAVVIYFPVWAYNFSMNDNLMIDRLIIDSTGSIDLLIIVLTALVVAERSRRILEEDTYKAQV